MKTENRADLLWKEKIDHLPDDQRNTCQHLFYGVVRNIALIEWAINQNVQRRPKGRLRALLLVGGFEILGHLNEGGGGEAAVVHHAVGRAKRLLSAPEARLVNAVLRRLPEALRPRLAAGASDPAGLALLYSHPEWLVSRWVAAFGVATTRKLLEWNQKPAPYYLRLFEPVPEWAAESLDPTPWPLFFRVATGGWAAAARLLREGRAYVQDPSTRLPPELLAPVPGERVLDLCAAPGGKSLLLAEALRPGEGAGPVCVDQPGRRLRRLEANLERYSWSRASVAGGYLPELTPAELRERGLPGAFDAVLIDVPCSNTGVFRRRVDARWTLAAGEPERLAEVQGRLLGAAAGFVRAGGRLVYSTCSIEPEENRAVAEAFAEASADSFTLEAARPHFPWETGHDGGGAFLFRRA